MRLLGADFQTHLTTPEGRASYLERVRGGNRRNPRRGQLSPVATGDHRESIRPPLDLPLALLQKCYKRSTKPVHLLLVIVTLGAAKGLVACVKEILRRCAPQNDSFGAKPSPPWQEGDVLFLPEVRDGKRNAYGTSTARVISGCLWSHSA